MIELLQSWPKQHDQPLVPADEIATALQTAEIAATTLTQIPFGQDHTDPARRARRQRTFWDRLKTICPRGTMALSHRRMAKSAELRKSMMKLRLPREIFGS